MRFLKASALMAAMLFSAIAMLGVLSMRGLPARGGSVPGATLNGDVNCDGKVDISDAISVIQYAFYGGTAPCAIAEDPTVLDKLDALASQIAALQTSVAALATPRFDELVNLVGDTPPIPALKEGMFYTVPEGKVLIITSMRMGGNVFNTFLIDGKEADGYLQTWGIKNDPAYSSASGMPLRAGQTLGFRNLESNTVNPLVVHYWITGYLRNA